DTRIAATPVFSGVVPVALSITFELIGFECAHLRPVCDADLPVGILVDAALASDVVARPRSDKYGKDKARIRPAGNHFVLAGSQWCITCQVSPCRGPLGAKMMTDGLAIDDRSKCAAEVADAIASLAFLDCEVVARESK